MVALTDGTRVLTLPIFPQGSSIMTVHCLSIADFPRTRLEQLFQDALVLQKLTAEARGRILEHKVMGMLFYQTSTRTRLSFETAMIRLGGKVVGFSDYKQTRAGDFFAESLEDTVRVIAGMVDGIVLRHFTDGAANRAASVSTVPVVNGGDGSNEHPTQVLCDLWTIRKRVGKLNGKRISLIGDPACRVTRSMIQALTAFDVEYLYFLPPPGKGLSEEQISTLSAVGIRWSAVDSVAEAIRETDIVWMIPFILPDFHDAAPDRQTRPPLATRFRLTASLLASLNRMPFILHTGPRGEELDASLDRMGNCLYFSQAKDAVEIRMALLATLLHPEWQKLYL
jgi:aspartate carbamoyltransferase catalytic subunit